MITLETGVIRSRNNYDLIRLIAALMVVLGHSFILFSPNGYTDPVKAGLKWDYSGSIAVYIFFFLSGIFITASFINTKAVWRFALMRVVRIWPALVCCVLVTVFLVGPVFSGLPLKAYLTNSLTRGYLAHNLFLYNIRYELPGVFTRNYYPVAVNGSLWTLPVELRCYLAVFVLGLAGLFKRPFLTFIVYAGITVLFFTDNKYYTQWGGGAQFIFFIAGSFAYCIRNYVYLDLKLWLAAVALCVPCYFISESVFRPVFYIVLMYSVTYAGTTAIARRINLPGDYSYGIYIYGFLVQQIIAAIWPHLTSLQSMLITMPLVIAIGILSWHFVESPMLNFGKNFRRARTIADKDPAETSQKISTRS